MDGLQMGYQDLQWSSILLQFLYVIHNFQIPIQ